MAGAIFNFGIGLTLVGDDTAAQGVDGIIDRFEGLAQEMGNLAQIPGINVIRDMSREAEPEVDSLAESILGASSALSGMHSAAMRVGNAFADIGDAVMSTSIFDLEHQAVRLTARLGEGRAGANAFQKSVLGIAEATETSVQSMGDIAFGLRAAGMEFDTATEAGRNNAATLAHMADTMGMTAVEATRFAASGRLMGASVTEMRDEALLFEKVYNIPGLLEQMPAAAETAIQAQARFGKEVVGDTKQAAFAVTKMAGQFSKALGKTTADAIRDAQENFNAFTGEISAFEDVFLGLADSFSPLQKAFFETGQGVGDVQRLMRQAQKDPLAFAESVDKIQQSLDPHMARRFEKQVLANLPEATRQIIMFEKQRKEAIAAGDKEELMRLERQKAAAEKQEEFNKLIGEMRGNVVDARKRLTSLMDVFRSEVGMDFAEAVTSGLETMVRWIGKGIRAYREFRDGLDPEQLSKFGKVIAGVVTAGAALSPVLGSLVAFTGPLGGGLRIIWDVASKLTNSLFGLSKAGGSSRGMLSGFGKVLGKLALPIGLIIAAIDGFKDEFFNIIDIVSNPSMSGADKIEKVFDQVVSGLWDTFDNFFLGFPQTFVDGFKAGAVAVNTEGDRALGQAIGDVIGKGTKFIVDKLKDWTTAFADWVVNVNWVDDVFWPILTGFASMGHRLLAFLGGIGESFFEAIGVPWEAAVFEMTDAWLTFKHGAINAWHGFANMFADAADGMKVVWEVMAHGITEAWYSVTDPLETGMMRVKNFFMDAVGGMKIGWTDVTLSLRRQFGIFVMEAVLKIQKLLQSAAEVAGIFDSDLQAAFESGVDAVAGIGKAISDNNDAARRAAADEKERIASESALREQALMKLQEGQKADAEYRQAQHVRELAEIAEAGQSRKQERAARMAEQQSERDALQRQYMQDLENRRKRNAKSKPATVANDATGVSRSAPVATPEEAAAAAGGIQTPAQAAQGAASQAELGQLVQVLNALAGQNVSTEQAGASLRGFASHHNVTAEQIKDIRLKVGANAGRLLEAVFQNMEAESINGTR